jgi:opacity protein-like surface antigen
MLQALVLAAGTLAGLAQAAEPAPYVMLHLGGNNLSPRPASVDFGAGVKTDGAVSLDGGAHAGLAVGRQTENGRFEVEYQHGSFDVTERSLGAARRAASDSGHYDALTANAYRTFAFTDKLSAFGGAGIGWGKTAIPQGARIGTCNCFPATSKGGLLFQARLGADYALGNGNHLMAQYTWISLPRAESGGSPSISYPRRGVNVLSAAYRKVF